MHDASLVDFVAGPVPSTSPVAGGWKRFFGCRLDDPFAHPDLLREGRYGVIEVLNGRLAAIHLRRFPRLITALEIEYLGRRRHRAMPGNRCLLYYNQPRRFPNFLALKYVVSQRDCTFATFRRAWQVLDRVAEIKRSDALLCDVWNLRISDRLLAREGWEPHKPERWHRHYIKRFYGVYPKHGVERGTSMVSTSTC